MAWSPEETAAIRRDAEYLERTTAKATLALSAATALRRIQKLEDRILALQTKEPDDPLGLGWRKRALCAEDSERTLRDLVETLHGRLKRRTCRQCKGDTVFGYVPIQRLRQGLWINHNDGCDRCGATGVDPAFGEELR